jgi:opacity protein-like surface antigen
MYTKAAKAPVAFIAPTVWQGFYIGGFAGGAYGRSDLRFAGAPTEGNDPYVFGPLGGGQIGYNHQVNAWVFGVEGDIGAANIKGSRTAGTATGLDATGTPIPGPGGFSPAYFTVQDKTSWMATATARVGYAYGRTLYYVRGGGAWEDSTVSATCSLGPTAVAPGRVCANQAGLVTAGFSAPSYTRTGWLIGFGTEFDLGKNWSAKTEYNYIGFGSHSALANDGSTVLTDKSYISQVKVGVNYRFSSQPVIAKY